MATNLAGAGATWGISGPTFLAIFLAVTIPIALGSVAHRTWLFTGRRMAGYDQLRPEQVGYLNGEQQLAIYVALGGLCAIGAIGAGPHRTLVQTGPAPIGATGLTRAIYHATGRVGPLAMTQDAGVAAALARLRRELCSAGLVLSLRARWVARIGPLLLSPILVIGFARYTVSADNEPIGNLVLALIPMALICAFQLVRTPFRTRAGNAALRSLRAQHAHLNPKHRPAYTTYGAASAALGVALFGTAALWTLDPSFAAAAGAVVGPLPGASTSGGSGGADGGGGGGGCGGGGCGGGGCGGGGCGGGG